MVKGERSGYRQDPRYIDIYPLRQKGKEYETRKSYGGRQGPFSGASRDPTRRAETRRDTQSYGGWQGPVRGQAETPTRQAETLTLEGANQDIKESGHRSRRPPAHKGYNQFIKDARRSQRATQLSQLKPMEGKI